MSHFDDGALHAYLDGELAPVERAQVEAHLAECAACRTRLDEERGLIQRASQLLGFAQPPPPQRAAPPPLHQLRHPRPIWRPRMPLAWAASVVLALAVGYYAGGSSARLGPDGAESDAVAGVAAAPAPVATGLSGRSVAEQAGRQRRVPPPAAAAQPRAPEPSAAPPEPPEPPEPPFSEGAVRAREENAKVAAQPSAVVSFTIDGDLAGARDRLDVSDWPVIGRDPAGQLLGADPVGIPGLAVREMRRSPAGDSVVLVEQQVDSATVIQLFQRRAEQLDAGGRVFLRGAAPAARAAAPDVRGSERLARFVGSLRVEIAGPLSPDSLNKLLEQLRPIP